MENNRGKLTTYTYRVSDGELPVAPAEWAEGQNAYGTTWPAEAAVQEGLQEAAGQWDAEPGLHYGPVLLSEFVDGRWLSQDALAYQPGETNLYPYCYDTPASDEGELYHDVPNTVYSFRKDHGYSPLRLHSNCSGSFDVAAQAPVPLVLMLQLL
jgi:hypothetical protein